MCNDKKIPTDVLKDVFPAKVRERLISKINPSQELIYRLEILKASGPDPADSSKRTKLCDHRKRKSAWEAYLFAAFAIGLFDDEDGRDLRARLASTDDNNFRSAMAECMGAWVACR